MNALELIESILEQVSDRYLEDIATMADDGDWSELESLKEGLRSRTVQLATQPSWPLAFTVSGVVTQESLNSDEYEEYLNSEEAGLKVTREHFGQDECTYSDDIVWLVEGGQPDHPYAPRAMWQG